MLELDRNLTESELVDKPLLQVNNLSYKYPFAETQALENISFKLREGEALGVAGESGSGKTTLLYAISGYIPHFFREGEREGNVLFNDKEVSERSLLDTMRETSVVFQDPSTQSFGMRVEDALTFGMENIEIPRDEMLMRLNKVSEQLRIKHLLGRSTLSLSGGESQAVAIASMLAMNPKAILFDETISALDPAGQQRVRKIIKDLKDEGKTMLVVDSDINWLSENVDRLLIMNDGQLIYEGDPAIAMLDKELSVAAGIARSNGQINFRERAAGEPNICVQGVSYTYDGKSNALDDINLNIRAGSCTAFVGHNGSGKSTLAQIISGGLKPTTGSAKIDKKELYRLPAKDAVRLVGYVYQNPSRMFSSHTVKEEFMFTSKILNEEPRVGLSKFKLDHLQDASPWDLSAGQQQLLGLASVLAADPNIIIFDEPTLGQTKRARENITEIIFELQGRGKTVILISHDMEFVGKSAQEVHVLDKGRLVKSGGTKEIFYDEQLFKGLDLPLPLES